jgi:hypothetical protein
MMVGELSNFEVSGLCSGIGILCSAGSGIGFFGNAFGVRSDFGAP